MAIYIKKNGYWMLTDEESVLLETDEDTGFSFTETENIVYESYVRNRHWLLDNNNNVVLGNDDTIGTLTDESDLLDEYANSSSSQDYTAFAVYSDTDNSLIFYYDEKPLQGKTYNGRIVSEIYTGWDTTTYTSASSVPWYLGLRFTIKFISFDRSYSNNVYPVSTAYWFYGFTNNTTFNFDNFDTSKVTNMQYMFYNCNSEFIDVSSFETSNVTNMQYMFNGCSKITLLNLFSFDTSKVTSYSNFATGCDSLEEIKISSNFDLFVKSTTALVDQEYWHDGKSKTLQRYLIGEQGDLDCFIGQISGTTFAIYSADDGSLTFYYGIAPDIGDVYSLKTVSNIYIDFLSSEYTEANPPEWHEICTLIKSASFDASFSNIKPEYISYWFYEMENCTSLDITYLDTSKAIGTHDAFSGLTNLASLDVSKLDVRNVNVMYGMFYNCIKLSTIDVSNWKTDSLTDAHGIFDGCSGLKEVDITGWDTSKVTDIERLFQDCSSLTEVDLSNFDSSKVTNMKASFNGCTSLKTIYSDDDVFITTNVGNGSGMFTNCTSLVGGNGTSYSSSYTGYTYAHVDTSSNPGYFTQLYTAFAIYCEDDNSLIFYGLDAHDSLPTTGSTYNGKKVSTIYTGFDTEDATFNRDSTGSTVQWNAVREDISSVSFNSSFSRIRPISTACWFAQFSSCTSIDFTNLNTSKVTSMSHMFYKSWGSAMSSIDVSGFNTSNVTNMEMMFYSVYATAIYSNDTNFVTTKVTNSDDMFYGATSLVGGNGTAYNSSKVDASMAHIDTSSNPGYFTSK